MLLGCRGFSTVGNGQIGRKADWQCLVQLSYKCIMQRVIYRWRKMTSHSESCLKSCNQPTVSPTWETAVIEHNTRYSRGVGSDSEVRNQAIGLCHVKTKFCIYHPLLLIAQNLNFFIILRTIVFSVFINSTSICYLL